jgi:hypothetical protein
MIQYKERFIKAKYLMGVTHHSQIFKQGLCCADDRMRERCVVDDGHLSSIPSTILADVLLDLLRECFLYFVVIGNNIQMLVLVGYRSTNFVDISGSSRNILINFNLMI